MSSVDNRVVNMEFNNKAFEQGVAQTLKSIERLKESLNFKNSSKSISDLEKSVKNLNTSNLTKAVNELKRIDKNVNLKNSTKSIDDLQSKNRIFSLSNIINAVKNLGGLKDKLNFKESTKSLGDLKSKSDSFDMGSLINAVESVSNRFSTLGVIGMTVLQNITNAALNAGKNMLNALSLQPITEGFQEYETQMGAIQTILANTASKGSSLNDVNNALNTLNTYADKTIYNFTEMTRNIGTFTAAGVDLQTSVDSIQGIANLAAMSGSTSQQASTAMYQLSQAIATGTVKLMDWNSVVNAGMGGQVFQDALIRTSEHLKTGAKAAIQAKGSFRESLSEGWLTTQVLTETLRQFSLNVDSAQDYERAVQSLVEQGYTKEEATNIANMAKTAGDAATKVKTFSQLIDTLREALGSGWTNSWQIILGDFEEAKDLFTNISDTLSNIVNESANARNALLTSGLSTSWKQLLNEGISDEQKFMETTKQVARDHGVAVDDIISKNGSFAKSLKDGWADSSILSESISKMADEVRGLGYEELKAKGYTEDQAASLIALDDGVKNGSINLDNYAKKMTQLSGREHLINALSNAFTGLSSVVGKVRDSFRDIFPAMTGEQLYFITEAVDNFSKKLVPSEKTLNKVGRAAKGFFAILDLGKQSVMAIVDGLKQFGESTGFSVFTSSLLDAAASIGDFLVNVDEAAKKSNVFTAVSQGVVKVLSTLASGWKGFSDTVLSAKNILSNVITVVKSLASSLSGGLKTGLQWLKDNVTLDDIFSGIKAGSLLGMAANLVTLSERFGDFVDTIKGALKRSKDVFGLKAIGKNISEFFKTVGTALTDFTGTVKFGKLLIIAASVAMLVDSMKKLSELNQDQLTQGLVSIGVLLAELNIAVGRVAKSLDGTDTGSIIKASAAMVLMATAIKKLAKAMVIIAGLDIEGVAKGLISVRVLMSGLAKFTQKANMSEGSIKTAAVLIAMAEAIKILSGVMKTIGSMDVESIGKGLASITVLLGDLVAASKLLNKVEVKPKTSVGLLALAESLKIISEAMAPIGKMKTENIVKGISGITAMLSELVVATLILGKFSNNNKALEGAASVLILSKAMANMAAPLERVGYMPWENVEKGLVGLGGALTELVGATVILDKFTGITGGLTGAASILILSKSLSKIAEAMSDFGSYPWAVIQKGLVAMGIALAELVAAVSISGLSGLSGILGSLSLDLIIPQLDSLATALDKFGNMSWDQIKKGLVGMGGALAELVVALGVEGLTGIAGLLGGLSLDLIIPQLDSLATALDKFGNMSWDQIKKGFAGMMSAMGATGLGGLLNTLSGFGAGAIKTVAKPLGDLATSVAKWSGVVIPDNLGSQLGKLASGIMPFTLSGFGAGAIKTVAKPLGDLATSVAKWSGVVIPDGLGDKLKKIADGVNAFTLSGLAADPLSKIAKPLGSLATSVAKWSGVVIPDGFSDKLGQISQGVNQFTLSGLAGASISGIVDPLKNLATSVKAWEKVKIDQNFGVSLEQLGKSLNAFMTSGISGTSMSLLVDPLKNLAGSVNAWKNVSISESLTGGLKNLSTAISSFESVSEAAGTLKKASVGLLDIASSASTLGTADLVGIGQKIEDFATKIKEIPSKLSGVSEGIGSSMASIASSISLNSSAISTAFAGVINSVSASLTGMTGKFTESGRVLAVAFGDGFTVSALAQGVAASAAIRSTVNTIIIAGKNQLAQGKPQLKSAAESMMKGLTSGIKAGKSSAVSAMKSVNNAVKNAVSSKGFRQAGYNMTKGLANGIASGKSEAVSAAVKVATAALKAAKNALGEKSPSRITHGYGEYFDQGLINGIMALKKKVGYAAADVGTMAVKKMDKSLATFDSSSIKPVIDADNMTASLKNRTFTFNAKVASQITNPMNNVRQAIEDSNIQTMASNNKVLTAITDLNDNLAAYAEAVNNSETAMYLDGKKLASSIAKPMNQQLGVLARRGF